MSSDELGKLFLESTRSRFEGAKRLAEGAMAQLADDDLFWAPDPESNSIAVIVQHLHGNMISRWTDFLTTDGEKPTRDRDGEFASKATTRPELMRLWEEGWQCLLDAIASLEPADLQLEVTIRGEKLGVIDAIHRQIAHYSYHVGQIVYIARQRRGPNWQTLSIARNRSREYKPTQQD